MKDLFAYSDDTKIALVSDELTAISLGNGKDITYNLTNNYWTWLFKIFKPDFILVESVWRGYKDTWRYKIANYPDYPERNNVELRSF